MVAWLIRAATAVFGQTEFGVRAGALLCGAITSIFVYKLTRNLFGAAAALAALLLVQALPFFFLSGPAHDPGCAAGRSVGGVAVLSGARIDWQPIPGLVVCRHLPWHGNDFKIYHRAARPRGGGLHAWDPQSRRWWTRSEPYVGALLALAIFSPVIIWNAQHEWASFAFQTSRRLGGDAAIRPAQADRLHHRLDYPDRTAGRDCGAVELGTPPTETPDAARRRRLFNLAILVPALGVRLVQFAPRSEAGLDRRTLDGGAACHGLRHGESRSRAGGSRHGFAPRGCPPSSSCY